MRADLDAKLHALPIERVLDVVRAFSYFSHLANIAEDVHQNRRRRAHRRAGSPPRPGSLEATLAALTAAKRRAGDDASRCSTGCRSARCSPRTRPRSSGRASSTASGRSPRLLAERERALDDDERRCARTTLRRLVLMLWQTAMLRLSKLQVVDEIENGLQYFRLSFLRELPAVQMRAEKLFGVDHAAEAAACVVGTWIGGDRDGNPFVTAETMRHAASARMRASS